MRFLTPYAERAPPFPTIHTLDSLSLRRRGKVSTVVEGIRAPWNYPGATRHPKAEIIGKSQCKESLASPRNL